jgi:nucleotide-binding universal stress UspA family protein
MPREDVILVGVDGSEASEHALEWAIQEARRRNWSIKLSCAYALPAFSAASLEGGYAVLDSAAVKTGAQGVVEECVKKVEAAGLKASSYVEVGDPAGVLVELSKTARMAVVGTRGRGGFAERLMGTVSSALPAHGHCPTVVVPLRTPQTDRTQIKPIRRIVVGVDGSASSDVALERAVKETMTWDATLTAFSSVPVSTGAGLFAWAPGAVDHEAIMDDLETGLDAAIERVVKRVGAPEDLRIRRHGLDGTASSLLVEFSTAVDLVVVGSRGRGGFAGLLLGSTSQAVLHHAACPVMVVPTRVKDEGLPPEAVAGGGLS